MAPRIERRDKSAGTFLHWHQLNKVVERIGFQSGEENPLAEWDIFPAPLVIQYPNNCGEKSGQLIETDWRQLIASDDLLPVGRPVNDLTYGLLTNRQWLDIVETSLSGLQYKIESAGSCRNKGRTFLAVKIDGLDDIEINGDKVENILNFINSFDQSANAMLALNGHHVVCDNTVELTLVCHSPLKVRWRHRKGSISRIDNMPEIVEQSLGITAQYKAILKKLSEYPIDQEQNKLLLIGFEGGSRLSTRALNKVNRENEIFVCGPGNKGKNLRDTWGAITDFYSHESSGGESRWKQFESSEFGSGANRKQEFARQILKTEKTDKGKEFEIDDEQIDKLVIRGEKLLADYDKRATEKTVDIV